MTIHIHQDGLLELRFAPDASRRTVLTHRRQRFPLRLTVPHYLDESDRSMPFVIVQNPTGGVFAGDRLHVLVEAEANARVHLRTQSATKLYQMDGGCAEQSMVFRVEDGAYVEYLPDATIPQTGAALLQHVTVDAMPHAAFVTAETIAAGRVARGERFRFAHLEFTTCVKVGGIEVCIDVLDLDPRRVSPSAPGMLGSADYISTVLALCPGQDAAELARRVDASIAAIVGDRGGASTLPDAAGVVGRILARSATEARAAVFAAWQTMRLTLIGRAIPRRLT